MLAMVAYSRRPQSGQITCYLNRTYHVLLTRRFFAVDFDGLLVYMSPNSR